MATFLPVTKYDACNLFSGHITSGVKLAGMHLGRLYGTREVIVRAESCKTSAMMGYIRAMAADLIVVVKKLLKDSGAKG